MSCRTSHWIINRRLNTQVPVIHLNCCGLPLRLSVAPKISSDPSFLCQASRRKNLFQSTRMGTVSTHTIRTRRLKRSMNTTLGPRNTKSAIATICRENAVTWAALTTTAMCLMWSLRFCDTCSSNTPALGLGLVDQSNATWATYARSLDARPWRAGSVDSTKPLTPLILKPLGGTCQVTRAKLINGLSVTVLSESQWGLLSNQSQSPPRRNFESIPADNLSYLGCLCMCEKSTTARTVAWQNNGSMASTKQTDLRKTFQWARKKVEEIISMFTDEVALPR